MISERVRPVAWRDGAVVLLDQRRLPGAEVYVQCDDVAAVVAGIRDMVVRGAPAIGIAAAMGVALAACLAPDEPEAMDRAIDEAVGRLNAARPTAVNLAWATGRMQAVARAWRGQSASKLAHSQTDLGVRQLAAAVADLRPDSEPQSASLLAPSKTASGLREVLVAEALRILDEDVAMNRAMGQHGAALLPDRATVMTHCNAGALATGGYGTALGVIRAAAEAGKDIRVIACETRPYLQGARLTAWEMVRDGFDVTLITDNMAGHLMATNCIDAVIVGADRIAANGDTANKIGTYTHAVLAARHHIPFYVAAPSSTLDPSIPDGSHIPIEERPIDEVLFVGQTRIAADGVKVRNPAFDVTPWDLITAIITERGVFRANERGFHLD